MTEPLQAPQAPGPLLKPGRGDAAGRGLLRSSRVMALGTLASRLTGFVRTVIIATAIGLQVGDAYNIANTVPNILYDLLLGGVLASVVVPLLVQAERRGRAEGEAYAQRLVTLTLTLLTVVSVIAVLAAPWIVAAYGLRGDKLVLGTTFARFFLPQILFYGLGAVLGAILNTRGSFGPPMWTPVLNNLVVIATGGLFIAITSTSPQPDNLSTAQTLVLAVGTTAGIVVQTLALLPFLRSVGFRLRLRWDWRGAGFRSAGVFAAWMLGYVLTNQVGYLAVANLATAAGRAMAGSDGGASAYSPYTYAFILFSLPYAVIAVSVITALFPQMSRSGAAADGAQIARDLAGGLNLSGALLVPASAALVVLGPLIGTVVFAHANIGIDGARLTGATLAGFAIGLVPFSAFQLQLRAWLALRDSRTPTLVNLATTAVNLLADVALYLLLPPRERVVGLAVGFAASYVVGVLVFARLLPSRIGTAPGQYVARTHVRLLVASIPAAVVAYLLARVVTAGLGLGPGAALVAVAAALAVGTPVFVAVALRLRVDALRDVGRVLRRSPR